MPPRGGHGFETGHARCRWRCRSAHRYGEDAAEAAWRPKRRRR
jgi:hypothetical protein